MYFIYALCAHTRARVNGCGVLCRDGLWEKMRLTFAWNHWATAMNTTRIAMCIVSVALYMYTFSDSREYNGTL